MWNITRGHTVLPFLILWLVTIISRFLSYCEIPRPAIRNAWLLGGWQFKIAVMLSAVANTSLNTPSLCSTNKTKCPNKIFKNCSVSVHAAVWMCYVYLQLSGWRRERESIRHQLWRFSTSYTVSFSCLVMKHHVNSKCSCVQEVIYSSSRLTCVLIPRDVSVVGVVNYTCMCGFIWFTLCWGF